MAGNGNGLKPKQREALAALLTGSSVAATADAIGIGERTLHRWLKEDAVFIAELRALEEEMIDVVTRRLISLQTTALDTVDDALNDDKATHHVRLRAAGMVLDHMLKLREIRDIEERLAQLEDQLAHG